MITWFDFLTAQNALGHVYPDFDHSSDSPLLVPMTRHRLLQVTGQDAVKFLQGQVTCDLRRLSQQEHLLGAHCSAKGRMISGFTLANIDQGETLGLRLRANLVDKALDSLRKYIVFSKARIDTASLVPLAILGTLKNLPFASLPGVGKSLGLGETVLLRHAEAHLEIWTPENAAQKLWLELSSLCTPASPYHLERRWVEQGLAEVQMASAEEFVPQMFNYHLIDGVSFKKGCYTGQEIIARMQYRGQLKKHTYAISSAQPLDLELGATLVGAGADAEKTLATVVAAAPGANNWRGLVVTNSETQENEAYLVEKKTGAKLAWLPLPYAIPKH
jgi:folate-binding protein YgfZ